MRGSPSGPVEIISTVQTIDFANVPTITTPDDAIAVTNAVVGDTVLCAPMGVWDAGLTLPQGRCLVAGTVQFRIANPTAAGINPASQSCNLTFFRVRPTT